MLKLPQIMQAQRRLEPYINHTPLIYSDALSERSQANVWLKLELQQPTGSFKVRGATHKIMRLTADERARGIVTASAGNHGLAVARAATLLDVSNVTIFVPQTIPTPKLTKLTRFPVAVEQVGQSYEEAHQAAETFAAQNEATYIPAYNDLQVIAGAGTCGLEIMTDLPETEAVIVPIGGGGLVAGVSLAVKGINPHCHIYGAQPAASPAARLSLEQNRPIDPYDHEPTIADGLAGGFGLLPFDLAHDLIEEILLFDEAALRQAIFTLADQEQLIVEASGAIAIAPLLAEQTAWQGKTVVCLLSGGNLATPLLSDILGAASSQ